MLDAREPTKGPDTVTGKQRGVESDSEIESQSTQGNGAMNRNSKVKMKLVL